MRRVVLVCSALLLIATRVEAQPILKRDDTPAPVAAGPSAAAAKKGRVGRRGRAVRQEASKPAAPGATPVCFSDNNAASCQCPEKIVRLHNFLTSRRLLPRHQHCGILSCVVHLRKS